MAETRSPDEMLCSSLTTETGSIIELWETERGFELLFAEAHRPTEVVHAVELRPIEVESLAGSWGTAVHARAADKEDAPHSFGEQGIRPEPNHTWPLAGEEDAPCTCTIACIPQGITDEQTCRLRLEGDAT